MNKKQVKIKKIELFIFSISCDKERELLSYISVLNFKNKFFSSKNGNNKINKKYTNFQKDIYIYVSFIIHILCNIYF